MEKLDFLLRILNEKINHQLNVWNSLDQKLGLLSGFIATIIGAEVILMKDYIGINVFSLSALFLLISLTICLSAICPRSFYDPIDLDIYYTKKFLKKSLIAIKNKAVADSKGCFEKNSLVLEKKSLLFMISIVIFIIGILLLLISARQIKRKEFLNNDRREVVLQCPKMINPRHLQIRRK